MNRFPMIAGIAALLAIALIGAALYSETSAPMSPDVAQTASAEPLATTTPHNASNEPERSEETEVINNQENKPNNEPPVTVTRIEDPYPFPPLPVETVNVGARAALVNILCMPQAGSLRPTSGSGVIIDPRGVVLTNAHIAQYVLLSQVVEIDLSCLVRRGSPAQASWRAEVMYLPPEWVAEHAKELNTDHPSGTGEYDYALLRLVNMDGSPIQGPVPFVQFDTREKIGFVGDQILVAGYPVEFVGGITAMFNLYPVTSVTAIQELLTFGSGSVDMFSVGGVIGAQGGASGGPVLNAWGRLIGIITTTSAGATTAERDLRALNLNYIDNSIHGLYGKGLAGLLDGDISRPTSEFRTVMAPALIDKYIKIPAR